MFMGLFVLGASVAARRWMDSGDGEIVLAVLAGVVSAGTSVIAMITQKKRRASWKKYGKGRSHRRARKRDGSRTADAEDQLDELADSPETSEPPSLRELARAFSETRAPVKRRLYRRPERRRRWHRRSARPRWRRRKPCTSLRRQARRRLPIRRSQRLEMSAPTSPPRATAGCRNQRQRHRRQPPVQSLPPPRWPNPFRPTRERN